MQLTTTDDETLHEENHRLHQRIADLEYIIDHLSHLLTKARSQDKSGNGDSDAEPWSIGDSILPIQGQDHIRRLHQSDSFLAKLAILEQRVDTMMNPDTNAVSQETLDVAVAIEQLRNMGAALSYAHNALIAERLRYQELFDQAPDGYIVTDMQGIIEDANEAAAAMLGIRSRFLRNLPLYLFIPYNIRTPLQEQLRYLQSGTVQEITRSEMRLQPHKQPEIYVSLSVRVAYDAQDSPIGLRWMLHDITERKLAEDVLHQYKNIVSATPDAILLVDSSYTYRIVNKPYLTRTGKQYHEIVGHTVAQVIGDDVFATIVKEQLDRCLRGETIRYAQWFEFEGEGRRFIDVTYTPYRDRGGAISGVLVSTRDITDIKQAEDALRQSEQNYRMLAHNIPDGVVFLFDRDMRFQVAAGKQLAAVGMSSAMLEGKTLREAVPPDIAAIGELLYRTILNGTAPPELEQSYGDRVYRTQPVSLRNEQGEIVAGMIISQDITERTQMERDLREARDLAETATRARSAFLAHMSHELRTPLNAILGFSQLMALKPGYSTEDYTYLDSINRSGEHLLMLIDNVLNLSRIETGHVEWYESSFNLYHLIASVQRLFTLSIQHKGIAFTVTIAPDVPRTIVTDEMKLRQVLMNLISNAVKFTKQGGVSVRVTGAETIPSHDADTATPVGCRLLFDVEDTGPGIAADELSDLFDSCVQPRTGQWASESIGLGLAVCRGYVQLMGGDMTVRSEVGRGSVFTFDIRVRLGSLHNGTSSRQSPHTVAGLVPNQPNYRILVADDHAESRQLLVSLLATVGFDVREASNGIDACALWERWQPHLVLSDIRLPFLDGYELARRIRATPQSKRTTLVAVTTSAFDEDRAAIIAAGYDNYMIKPLRMGDIFEMIARYLGVSYQYFEPEPVTNGDRPSKDIELSAASLARLPNDIAASLHYAATIGDIVQLAQVIEAIRGLDEQLAAQLQGAVDTFRFDLIVRATQHMA